MESEGCSKGLCLRIIGIADLPSAYGLFKIVAFENKKDKRDHIVVVREKSWGRRTFRRFGHVLSLDAL